jgi:hypothetical protein
MSEAQPQMGTVGRGYARDILDTDADGERMAAPMRNLLSKDYPLANIERQDREYFRLLAENIAIYVEEEFPPEDSLVQGQLGQMLLEDASFESSALTPREKTEYQTILMASSARTSRGLGGWQQEEFSKSTNVRRVEDNRGQDPGTGLIGGLFQ